MNKLVSIDLYYKKSIDIVWFENINEIMMELIIVCHGRISQQWKCLLFYFLLSFSTSKFLFFADEFFVINSFGQINYFGNGVIVMISQLIAFYRQ